MGELIKCCFEMFGGCGTCIIDIIGCVGGLGKDLCCGLIDCLKGCTECCPSTSPQDIVHFQHNTDALRRVVLHTVQVAKEGGAGIELNEVVVGGAIAGAAVAGTAAVAAPVIFHGPQDKQKAQSEAEKSAKTETTQAKPAENATPAPAAAATPAPAIVVVHPAPPMSIAARQNRRR